MNTFVAILGDSTEQHLLDWLVSCEEALRPVSSKLLKIQPHILLVQTEKGMRDVFDALPTKQHPDVQVILLSVLPGWRGSANLERFSDLQKFFAAPAGA